MLPYIRVNMVDKLKKEKKKIHNTKLTTRNRPKLITDLIQALSLMKAYNKETES